MNLLPLNPMQIAGFASILLFVGVCIWCWWFPRPYRCKMCGGKTRFTTRYRTSGPKFGQGTPVYECIECPMIVDAVDKEVYLP